MIMQNTYVAPGGSGLSFSLSCISGVCVGSTTLNFIPNPSSIGSFIISDSVLAGSPGGPSQAPKFLYDLSPFPLRQLMIVPCCKFINTLNNLYLLTVRAGVPH